MDQENFAVGFAIHWINSGQEKANTKGVGVKVK